MAQRNPLEIDPRLLNTAQLALHTSYLLDETILDIDKIKKTTEKMAHDIEHLTTQSNLHKWEISTILNPPLAPPEQFPQHEEEIIFIGTAPAAPLYASNFAQNAAQTPPKMPSNVSAPVSIQNVIEIPSPMATIPSGPNSVQMPPATPALPPSSIPTQNGMIPSPIATIPFEPNSVQMPSATPALPPAFTPTQNGMIPSPMATIPFEPNSVQMPPAIPATPATQNAAKTTVSKPAKKKCKICKTNDATLHPICCMHINCCAACQNEYAETFKVQINFPSTSPFKKIRHFKCGTCKKLANSFIQANIYSPFF